MKEIGGSCSVEKDIFGQEYYGAQVSPMSKLKVVCGKKTVMVYRPDGEKVFFAGRSPNALRMDGMHYFLGWDTALISSKQGQAGTALGEGLLTNDRKKWRDGSSQHHLAAEPLRGPRRGDQRGDQTLTANLVSS